MKLQRDVVKKNDRKEEFFRIFQLSIRNYSYKACTVVKILPQTPAYSVSSFIKHRHTLANTSARRAVHKNYGNLQFVLSSIIFLASAGTHVHLFLS